MFYSVFHNSRAFKCVVANFIFSQKNDVTLTRHDVMTRSHRKSRLQPFRAENIFRKSHRRNFGCWSSCLSNRQKCALGGNFLSPLGRGRVKPATAVHFIYWTSFSDVFHTSRHQYCIGEEPRRPVDSIFAPPCCCTTRRSYVRTTLTS